MWWWSRSRRVYEALRDEPFKGKIAVVTGGARGLGLAISRRLAHAGATVVLVSRSEHQLRSAVDDLRRGGHSASFHVCDVTDSDAVHGTIRQIVSEFGGIDVLVNAAGVIGVTPFAHATAADFELSLQTHFWGPYYTITAALPSLSRRRGRVINISSIGGRIAVPHLLPYSVGKFALCALSDGLNAELADRGVSVLTVTPGLMRTGSYRNVTVRGQHRAEATWFALASATPLTAVDASQAASQIVQSAIRREARLTIGGQARLAEVASAIAPELSARLARTATRLLPAPQHSREAGEAKQSADLDLGWVTHVLPTTIAAEMNQRIAGDERGAGFRARGRQSDAVP
jgi:NAD(P)-dependent dehydrogenase (short-subunit alcohol dehydrogenase family)